MTTILRIDTGTGIRPSSAFKIANDILASYPFATIMSRDLRQMPVPRVDQRWMAANFRTPARRSGSEKDILALSDALVAELLAADIIIICAEISENGLPQSLRGWAEQLARAGLTLGDGREIMAAKRVTLCLQHDVAGRNVRDLGAALWLRHALAAIGIQDVTILASEMPLPMHVAPRDQRAEPAFA